MQTTKLKQEVEQITRQQKLDLERRDALEAKLNELKARKAYGCAFPIPWKLKGAPNIKSYRQLEESEAQYESRQAKVEEFIASTQQKKGELEETLSTVSSANKRAA